MSKIFFSGSFTRSFETTQSNNAFSKCNYKNANIMHLFCNYISGDNTYCVILPSESWADTIVTVNGTMVDLKGEYDSIINSIIRKARAQFPIWAN